jgi:DNA-binding transcriptional LysR family regulator
MELDLGAVRSFLTVVDGGHFGEAADRLGMTQQAVSKRIARLEADLGVTLLNRSRAGARPTQDGAAFLPHARALIGLADQAAAMFQARRRALRIDVLARDAAPVEMVRDFYEAGDVLAVHDYPFTADQEHEQFREAPDAQFVLHYRDRLLLAELCAVYDQRSTEAITVGVVYGAEHIPAVVNGLWDRYQYRVREAQWMTAFVPA